MSDYSIVGRHDFGMFGNYAFGAGDIDGDRRAEFAMMSRQGDYLLVLDHDGEKAWDAFPKNKNNWGTTPLLVADVNGDGRCEILVPEDRGDERCVVVFDGSGRELARLSCPGGLWDYDGAVIDALEVATRSDGTLVVLVLVNGGFLYAFERLQKQASWRFDATTRYFEHYLHVGDTDGDGSDEVVFSGSPGQGHDVNPPDVSYMHVVNLDGHELWRKPLSEIAPGKPIDHLDFVKIAPVVGGPGSQCDIVAAMGGCVLDGSGNTVWSLNDAVGHCDWVDVGQTPGGPLVLFSTHNPHMSVLLADAGGNELWRWDAGNLSADNCVTGQARFIDWNGDGQLEIVVGEQTAGDQPMVNRLDYLHEMPATGVQTINLYVLGLDGSVIDSIPVRDLAVRGWWYNGESRPLVLDVDGDGGQEWVWQARMGAALVVDKNKGA